MIRLTRPFFSSDEPQAVADVLASGMLVQGPRVAEFEASVAQYLHSLSRDANETFQCVAVANGTVALELAVATTALQGGTGVSNCDEVIVPALTWPSPGHAVILRGATPVLVDIDPHTWCLDATAVPRLVTSRTVAIIAIDQFGVPADLPSLKNLSADLDLVEDAACAIGSSLHGVACGLLGDVATYSFHPRKVITTGEGGMLVTRDENRAMLLRTLRNHGQASPGMFHGAGPNARLSEMQAAIGVVQMKKLDEILTRRRTLAEEIRAAVPLAWQSAPDGAVVNHQTLGFVLPAPEAGAHAGDRRAARDALIAALREAGIEAGILSYALHRLPQFAAYAVNAARRFPVADAVVDGGVAVPLHPGMSSTDVHTVIDALRKHAAWAFQKTVMA